ncbi:MAG: hypothetical protein R2813_08510 [Flavobacteriales bacterium]
MATIRILIIAFVVAVSSACNVTRVVKPLEKGEKAVSASIGGPGIIFSGAPIPVPLSSLSYSHGLDTGVTVSAGIHTTSLAFGVLQLDLALGVNAFQLDNEKFGVTLSPGLHFLMDTYKGYVRTYPQLDALCWWQYSEKPNLFYAGAGTWVELVKAKPHNQVQQNELLPWVMIGHQFNRPKWAYTTEIKYLGMQHDTRDLVVDYISPSHHGTLGFYFGVSRRLMK